jgi:hypothetical protein
MQSRLATVYSIWPEIRFVPGGNAVARRALGSDSDGTVLIGKELLARNLANAEFSFWIILAHEYAHLLQFKRNVADAWQMEPHADFLAGWSLAKMPARNPYSFYQNPDMIKSEAMTMFGMGDLAFNSRDPHGPPELRARMVREGYALGDRDALSADLETAFLQGAQVADLGI